MLKGYLTYGKQTQTNVLAPNRLFSHNASITIIPCNKNIKKGEKVTMQTEQMKRSMKKVLNTALIFEILYILAIFGVTVTHNSFIKTYTDNYTEYTYHVDYMQLIFIGISVAFFLLGYVLFRAILRKDFLDATLFVSLIGIIIALSYVILPFAFRMVQNLFVMDNLSAMDMIVVSVMNQVYGSMKVFALIANLFLAYASGMFWTCNKCEEGL